MKKTMLILAAVALVLILLVGGGLWYLISVLSGTGGGGDQQSVESYLAENWPEYRLEMWDPDTGALRLGRSLRFTYAQLVKYGDQPEMRELIRGHLDTMEQIAVGMKRKCGVTPEEFLVVGRSSEGEAAYTVSRSGSVTACWDPDWIPPAWDNLGS